MRNNSNDLIEERWNTGRLHTSLGNLGMIKKIIQNLGVRV